MKLSLTDEQRAAVHTAICNGGGLLGAARAAGICKRTLSRIIGDDERVFLAGLVAPEAVTRDDLEALKWRGRFVGEHERDRALRKRYLAVLDSVHGDAIRARLEDEDERAARLQAEAEAARKAEAERKAAAAHELERQREEAVLKVLGERHRRIGWLERSFMVLYGTPDERREGLAGRALEVRRDLEGVKLGASWFNADQWRGLAPRFTAEARQMVADVFSLINDYAPDTLK